MENLTVTPELTDLEFKAFQALFFTIPEKQLLGIALRQLDPTPENIRRFLGEILWQFEAAPAATFEAVGFFNLVKFLNRKS